MLGGHENPFTCEFATGPHHEGYRWDVDGELTVGVVEDLVHQPPNPIHCLVMHVNTVVDFNNNEECQGPHPQAKYHNATYIHLITGRMVEV